MSKNRGIAQLALRIGALLAFLVSACQADVIAGGYNFTNFDGPGSGTNAGAGTASPIMARRSGSASTMPETSPTSFATRTEHSPR